MKNLGWLILGFLAHDIGAIAARTAMASNTTPSNKSFIGEIKGTGPGPYQVSCYTNTYKTNGTDCLVFDTRTAKVERVFEP